MNVMEAVKGFKLCELGEEDPLLEYYGENIIMITLKEYFCKKVF